MSAASSRSRTPSRRWRSCSPPGGSRRPAIFRASARGSPGGAFNLMGAAYGAKNVHGLKAYAGVKGAQFHTLLYSSSDGPLKAMIEADLFGQLRTGAASGLATRLMANPDAHTLGVIGTGRQSRTQARGGLRGAADRARAGLRPHAGASRGLCARARSRSSASRCVRRRRRKPAWRTPTSWSPSPSRPSRCAGPTGCAKGAHVNAAGANSGDRREVDAETVLRAAVKATDHRRAGQGRRRASSASWSRPASSPGPTSASSASSSPARRRAALRRPI